MNYKHAYIVLLTSSLLLYGCNTRSTSQLHQETEEVTADSINLDAIYKAKYLFAVINKNIIQVASSDGLSPVEVYKLNGDELPPAFNLFDIKISPSNKYLVWYSPVKGVLSLKIGENSTQVLRSPNKWLDNNPYFSFDHDLDVLYMVDDEGASFYRIDLETLDSKRIEVPFPFGNDYRISPDMSKVIFVSAFGQTEENPEYMFTTIEGKDPVRFTTKASLNLRQKVYWFPDSSKVITIGEGSELITIEYGQQTPEIFYEDPQGETISDLSLKENLLYYQTDQGWWHVLDVDTLEEVGRIPKQITNDIHRPKFIPWYDQSFLIEETIKLDPQQFKRLWITNYTGTKKQIIDHFDDITVESSLPQL